MRLLIIGSYFPKPENRLMGIWALSQARALQGHGFDVEVVSPTPWVPRAVTRLRRAHPAFDRASAWATCPHEYRWDEIDVHYPRWPVYHVGPHRRWADRHPGVEARLAWRALEPKLLAIARAHSPDAVLAHGSAMNGALAHHLHAATGLPYLVVEHDFDEIRSCAQAPRRLDLYRSVMGAAHCVVTVSRRMEADLARVLPGIRAQTIHNGAEPLPESLRARPRPRALDGRTVVFSAGGFYRRKGFPLLVRAFARVARAHPEAVLRIAGDGVDRPAVDRAIAEEEMDGRIELLGYLPHRDVQQEMVWSDLFALTGWDEPFATVFVEAMSAGNPILCTNDGGITDVVREGVHGRVVPPRDVEAAAAALGDLIREPETRARMGAEAQRLATSRLTWDANAARVGALLREAAA